MAALGWLLNLDFAAGSSVAPPAEPPPLRGGGGGPRRYVHYTPSVEPTPTRRAPPELKRLLRQVAETDSAAARARLERRARHAADAVAFIHDVQLAIRQLEREITSSARELDITHQWAQQMMNRVEDERFVLLLLLEAL